MTLSALNKRAMELSRERAAKIAEKRREAAASELMTAEQKGEYVANWTKEIDRHHNKAMAELKDDADYTARQVAEDGARVRPTFDANSAADLTRTEQAWRNIVLPQLEKGRTLHEALRNADQDAVLGAERFAAGYLNANQKSESFGAEHQDFTANVRSAVTNRLADFVEPEDAETLRAAARVDTELAAFHQVTALTESGDGLGAAITAHYATQPMPEPADSDQMAESA